MTVPFSGKTTREELVDALNPYAAVTEGNSMPQTQVISPKPTGERRENGQFATGTSGFAGNTGNRTAGLVALIKAQTKDYADLIQNLVTVSKGEELYGKKPSLRDMLDATNSLLDRSIGKPTQQVYHTSDEETKQLMADRARLHVLEAERKRDQRKQVTDSPVIEHESTEVTAIGALREQSKG